MSLFDTLLVGHLVGDFLFQTAWMAGGKKKHISPLMVHSTVYTLCIFVFSLAVGLLPLRDYLIIWTAHILIDSRKLTHWWVRTVMGAAACREGDTWLTIVVDQTCHLLVLYILVLFKA